MSNEFDMPTKEIVTRMSPEARLRAVGQPVGLTPRQANAVTQARLQLALSELAEGLADEVKAWIREVSSRSPAEAVRLYLELLEFRMPRMKAATVVANWTPSEEGRRRLSEISFEELERIVAEG